MNVTPRFTITDAVVVLLVVIAIILGMIWMDSGSKSDDAAKAARIEDARKNIARLKVESASCDSTRTAREADVCFGYQRMIANYEKIIEIENETTTDKFLALFR